MYLHPINNYDIDFVSGTPFVFYSVTYDPNGGTGTAYSVTEPVASAHTVLPNSSLGFTRSNCTFLGWNTDPAATAVTYTGTGIETVGPEAADAKITLYAVWRENPGVNINPSPRIYRVPSSPSFTLPPQIQIEDNSRIEEELPPPEKNPDTGNIQFKPLLLAGIWLVLSGFLLKFSSKKNNRM